MLTFAYGWSFVFGNFIGRTVGPRLWGAAVNSWLFALRSGLVYHVVSQRLMKGLKREPKAILMGTGSLDMAL